MKKSLSNKSHSDVLKTKRRLVTQINELKTPLPPDTLNPREDANLIYLNSAKMANHCQNFGQLSEANVQEDPSKCYAEGFRLKAVTVDEISTLTIHAINHQGKPCELPVTSLDCELISEIANTRVLGRVERIEQSKYKVFYQPTVKGRHNLHIKVNGQHINWSPFSVIVKSSLEKLGTSFLSITGVSGPCGVTFNHKQELVVSGLRDHYITVFSPDAKKILSFGTHGCDQGQFKYPKGVAVDEEENILVIDSANNRIQKFSALGQFQKAVGTKGINHLEFDRPCGIAFNTSNNMVYITDTLNNRVQVLNSDLTFSSSFGRFGKKQGLFADPHGIACSHTGDVYVADKYNHRIQVFTANGRSRKMFGKKGTREGELTCPIGVALDQEGMVYVSEDANHRISVFTPEGKFVKAFGSEGNEPGQFQDPRGIAIDENGVVCVCDCNNDRIQIF